MVRWINNTVNHGEYKWYNHSDGIEWYLFSYISTNNSDS